MLAISYNRPKICGTARWSPNGTTLPIQSSSGSHFHGIFVNTNNTIYIPDVANGIIQVWIEGYNQSMRTITANVGNPYMIFVTSNGDMYTSNGNFGQVSRWLPNATSRIPAMLIGGNCWGLFIDNNNTLYCSLGDLHYVVSMALGDKRNTLKLVAGKSCRGSTPNALNGPGGIFVDVDFKLYVADYNNDRVQLFFPGQVNATTVAGTGAPGTITLKNPAYIVLDHDGYLFIVDSGHNRIVASGPGGFRCIIGCSGIAGSAPDQLNSSQSMAFDSFGNIWVPGDFVPRVQKFTLDTSSCGKSFHLISSEFKTFQVDEVGFCY